LESPHLGRPKGQWDGIENVLKGVGTSEQGNEPSVFVRVGHFWLAKQLPAF